LCRQELRVAVGHASKRDTSCNRRRLQGSIGREFIIVCEEKRARTKEWCVESNKLNSVE